jgi:hypothetical protein
LFRFAGLEVPIFRDLPSTAAPGDSLLISSFSVRFRVSLMCALAPSELCKRTLHAAKLLANHAPAHRASS